MCRVVFGDNRQVDDSVETQYEHLPYPQFTTEDISNEERHYEINVDDPAFIAPAHTLEKINHYLHQGNESFR